MDWKTNCYLNAEQTDRRLAELRESIEQANFSDDPLVKELQEEFHPWQGESEDEQRERFEKARRKVLDFKVERFAEARDTATCATCGQEFAFYWLYAHGYPKLEKPPEQCWKCVRAAEQEERRQERLSAFREDNLHCYHYLYCEGSPPRPAQYKAVMDWDVWEDENNPVYALVSVGKPATGKTTACYRKAYELVDKYSYTDFLAVNSTQLNSIPEKVMDRSIGAFMERLKTVELLLIDDLDKVRITPRVASELWGLFEDRLRGHRLPLMITMNVRTKRDFVKLFSGKEAESRHVGESIYHRIKEVGRFIDFDVETEAANDSTEAEDESHNEAKKEKSQQEDS
jgi:DNA replication protein DnaC